MSADIVAMVLLIFAVVAKIGGVLAACMEEGKASAKDKISSLKDRYKKQKFNRVINNARGNFERVVGKKGFAVILSLDEGAHIVGYIDGEGFNCTETCFWTEEGFSIMHDKEAVLPYFENFRRVALPVERVYACLEKTPEHLVWRSLDRYPDNEEERKLLKEIEKLEEEEEKRKKETERKARLEEERKRMEETENNKSQLKGFLG